MNKLGVKKLIIFTLIAVTAITCFVSIGLLPNVFNKESVLVEQPYDLGIEYKDGWYLIDDAEDYYAMCNVTNTGSAPGAKFKLIQDITIDPRKAKSDNFINATFDGNGYNLTMELDPTYEPEVNQTTIANQPVNSYGGTQKIDGEYVDGVSIAYEVQQSTAGLFSETIGGSWDAEYPSGDLGGWTDVSTELDRKKYVLDTNYDEFKLTIKNKSGYNTPLAVGGLFGYTVRAHIKNVYLQYNASFSITSEQTRVMLGGLVGMISESTIENCAVDFTSEGNLTLNNNNYTWTKCGSLVGYVYYGSTIKNNIVMYDKDNKPNIVNSYNLVGEIRNVGVSTIEKNIVNHYNDSSLLMDIVDLGFSYTTVYNDKRSKIWFINDKENDGKPIQTCFVKHSITAHAGDSVDAAGWTDAGGYTYTKQVYDTIGNLPESTKSGWEVQWWTRNGSSDGNWGGRVYSTTEAIHDGTIAFPQYTMNIYAKWVESCTVTFVCNEGTWTRNVGKGDSLGGNWPDDPSWEGYTFVGWNTSENAGGTWYYSDTPINGNVTLYGIYKETEYEIRAYTRDGTISDAGWTPHSYLDYFYKKYKHTNNVPKPSITKTHWELLGWYYDKEGNNPVGDEDKVGDKAGDKKYIYIYAKWEEIQYTITLNLNPPAGAGVTCNTSGWTAVSGSTTIYQQTAPNSVTVTLPPDPECTNNNYIFNGWSGASSTTFNPTGNITITAQWKEQVTITADPNGGTGSADTANGWTYDSANNKYTRTFDVGANLTFPNPAPPTDHILDGWYTSKTGTDKAIKAERNVTTIYAQWLPIYTITLDLNTTNLVGGGSLSGYSLYTGSTYPQLVGNTIKYTTKSENFILPNSEEMTSEYYTFKRWECTKIDGEAGGWVLNETYAPDEGHKIYPNAGLYGNVTLTAKWEVDVYEITLLLNGGVVSYSLDSSTNAKIDNDKTDKTQLVIKYNVESKFNLPSVNQMSKRGYTLNKWKCTEVALYSAGWVKHKEYNPEQEIKGSSTLYGDVTLQATWTENVYNIVLHANNDGVRTGKGETKTYENVSYTSIQTISWDVDCANHVFIGWGVKDWDKILSYSEIYTNTNSGSGNASISGEWLDTKILKNGGTVSQLLHGNVEGSKTIDIYAIWSPVYTVTIEANGGTVYHNGNITTQMTITETNNYNTSYALHPQKDEEVFIVPEPNTGYRLYKYGHYIEGWVIAVGTQQYYVDGQNYIKMDKLDPGIDDWAQITDPEQLVASGTNLQYLQGNITATPMWKALTFEVQFVTKQSEGYKEGYRELDPITTEVVYGEKYIVNINGSDDMNKRYKQINTRSINGYTVIYGRPYTKEGVPDTNQAISLYKDSWNYSTLDYQMRGGEEKDDVALVNTRWYIQIEGYYLPDLYKVEINLDLPYKENNKFILNYNGYKDPESYDSLESKYRAVISSGEGYEYSEDYEKLQGSIDDGTYKRYLYKEGNKYYIYLLQDQIIQLNESSNEYGVVYNRYISKQYYTNGAGEDNYYTYGTYISGNLGDNVWNPGTKLPTFEIDYYEMQYYYAYDNDKSAYMYQVVNIDEIHKKEAENKVKEKYSTCELNLNYVTNWKYTYSNVLNVYWYRNIINIEITNLLNENNTFNAYTLIEEVEQVTKEGENYILKDHKKYHLVIYKYENDIYTYVTYSFNDIKSSFNDITSLLISGEDSTTMGNDHKYKYNNFTNMSDEELEANGITKKVNSDESPSNIIPIFFGNSFKVQAIDQSKDSSMDEFIGYRFDNYSYSITNKNDDASECKELSQFKSYENDGTKYIVTEDLKEYEYAEGKDSYLLDQDKVLLKVNFSKISYKFTYQVTDESYDLDDIEDKYGKIRLQYQASEANGWKIEQLVNVNNNDELRARMNVRLGSELVDWKLAYIDDGDIKEVKTFTEENSQTCRIVVNATFLRNYLYNRSENNFSSAENQEIGYMLAICKDIEFKINVKVKDISKSDDEGPIIREYTLSEDEENKLFTINEGSVISVDKTYNIVMMGKQGTDDFIYYYQDGRIYALRELYIGPSRTESIKQLVTKFNYPITSIDDIEMKVTEKLLDGSINHTDFTQVSEDNRYLTIYVEVAPTYEIKFKVNTRADDSMNGKRQLSIQDTIIASGDDKNELTLTIGSYLTYWGQELTFNFTAEAKFYESAKLSIDCAEGIDSNVIIESNKNAKLSITEDAVVTIELIPQTYEFDAYIEYQETIYNITEGKLPIEEVKNASGKQIFSSVTFEASEDNVASGTGVYYSGDKIYVSYELNSEVAGDFEVAIYINGERIYKENDVYTAKFYGDDIVARILVQPIIEEVGLRTNLPKYEVADIYARINGGEKISVGSEIILPIINGDKLSVFIKEKVGFKFTGKYSHSLITTEIEQLDGAGEDLGCIQIDFFKEGFDSAQSGWYDLIFKQIGIEIEFKYYEAIPNILEIETLEGYQAISNEEIIQKNSVVHLIQGKAIEGYRFESYSYGAPKYDDGSRELELTQLEDKKVQFKIDEDILEYLSTVEIVNDKLPLIIYVNHMKQFTYTLDYKCDPADISIEIKDNNENKLKVNEYYDYGTKLEIYVQATDSKHYKVEVEIINSEGEEVINTEKINANNIENLGDIVHNNLNNVSGFKAIRWLMSNTTIRLNVYAEKYDTILNQNLYKRESEEEELSSGLIEKGDELFNLQSNIYYKIEATHEYGTEVTVSIYVLIPPNPPEDINNQYYIISGANLNGNNLGIKYVGIREIDGNKAYECTFSYDLIGKDLLTEQKLDIFFSALYYIELKGLQD